MQHQHLVVRPGDFGADPEGQANTHRAEHARIEPVARHERRNRLAPVVENLLAVDDQNRIAIDEIAHFLAQSQWVDGLLVVAHGSFGFVVLAFLDLGQVLAPAGEAPRIDTPVDAVE